MTPAGLTPLHALAMYNTGWQGSGADHDEGGFFTTMHDGRGGSGDDEWPRDKSHPHSHVATTAPTAAPAGIVTSPKMTSTGATTSETASLLTTAVTAIALEEPENPSSHTGAVVTRKQWQQQHEHQLRQRKLSMNRVVRTIADLLLDAGSELNAVDGEGNTPLLVAAATGGAVLCELLLARGADSGAR